MYNTSRKKEKKTNWKPFTKIKFDHKKYCYYILIVNE